MHPWPLFFVDVNYFRNIFLSNKIFLSIFLSLVMNEITHPILGQGLGALLPVVWKILDILGEIGKNDNLLNEEQNSYFLSLRSLLKTGFETVS